MRARVTARLLLARPRVSLRLTRVVSTLRSLALTRPAHSLSLVRLAPSLLLLPAPRHYTRTPKCSGVRDCLSRPAVSKANDLPWNLDNLSARLQPPRPGLHLFCTRVSFSLSLFYTYTIFFSLFLPLSFLVCLSLFIAPPSVSFLRGANRVEGVLTRPLGDH